MPETQITIQEGLALLPDLESRLNQIKPLVNQGKELFEVRQKREQVQSGTNLMEDITVQIPKVDFKDVMKEYDDTAAAIRKLKNAIQKANLNTKIEFTVTDDVTRHELATA